MNPFLNHMTLLFPDRVKREQLLSFMADCVQKPEKKQRWAPVIVGVAGNGKNLITQVLCNAVGRTQSTVILPEVLITDDVRKLISKRLVVIEGIARNSKFRNVLKMLISDSSFAYVDDLYEVQKTPNKTNIVLTVNGSQIYLGFETDRRFKVFQCAQQNPEDIIRDGMDGEYFPMLFDWLQFKGYEETTQFLQEYPQ